MYKFRKKGLFLGGQNVISWGAQGGTGGAFAPPPSLYVKKGPAFLGTDNDKIKIVGGNIVGKNFNMWEKYYREYQIFWKSVKY